MKQTKTIHFPTVVVSVLAAGFVVFATGYASTTINSNIQTGGTLTVSGTTSLSGDLSLAASSSLQFANGWKMNQTTATSSTSTEVTIFNPSSQSVLIFDEN